MGKYYTRKVGDNITRVGSFEDLKIKNGEKVHLTYVEDKERIARIYDKDNELIGIDITDNIETIIKEVIYDRIKNKTVVILHYDDKRFIGVAFHNTAEDIYNAQIGYNIALARAIIKKQQYVIKQAITKTESRLWLPFTLM